MLESVRSGLSRAMPVVGTLYLVYLAVQPPPVRYVGVACLLVVTPVWLGWFAGALFDRGPWADGD